MKHLIVLPLIAITFFTPVTATAAPAEPLPDAALALVKSGIKTEADLQNFLLAAPTWTWERKGEGGAAIKFEADGTVTHPEWTAQWTVISSRQVVIRVPGAGIHTLTFAGDLRSYKGVGARNSLFSGKFAK